MTGETTGETTHPGSSSESGKNAKQILNVSHFKVLTLRALLTLANLSISVVKRHPRTSTRFPRKSSRPSSAFWSMNFPAKTRKSGRRYLGSQRDARSV